jgi:FkbM family methyltransferase
MQSYVPVGGVAYDVGAHIGYFTIVLSNLVGLHGKVFSFEPAPRNLAALNHNLLTNEVVNAVSVPMAVSSISRPTIFATFSYSSVNHIATASTPTDAELIRVQSTTLDDFVYRDGHPAPGFIKLDVEGAEVEVFRGAVRLLHEARPVIMAEIRGGTIWHDVSDLTASCGYTAQILKGGTEGMATSDLADVLFLPSGPWQGAS